MHAQESQAFLASKLNSLNATLNGQEPWKMDLKKETEYANAVERARYEIEDGIIKHLKAKRMQYLEAHVANVCYQGNDFTFLQAQKCEDYHYKNDYKLNLMSSFFSDHLTKHAREYKDCYTSNDFKALKKTEEKDRHFVACHSRWIKNLRTDVSQELEVKARQMFM